MARIQRNLFWRLGTKGDRCEYLRPNSALAPAGETIVDRLGRPVLPRAIDPSASDFQHMHDPAQNQSIVLACRTWLDLRQIWFDLRPLLIAEPKQMRIHRFAPEPVDYPLESKPG